MPLAKACIGCPTQGLYEPHTSLVSDSVGWPKVQVQGPALSRCRMSASCQLLSPWLFMLFRRGAGSATITCTSDGWSEVQGGCVPGPPGEAAGHMRGIHHGWPLVRLSLDTLPARTPPCHLFSEYHLLHVCVHASQRPVTTITTIGASREFKLLLTVAVCCLLLQCALACRPSTLAQEAVGPSAAATHLWGSSAMLRWASRTEPLGRAQPHAPAGNSPSQVSSVASTAPSREPYSSLAMLAWHDPVKCCQRLTGVMCCSCLSHATCAVYWQVM